MVSSNKTLLKPKSQVRPSSNNHNDPLALLEWNVDGFGYNPLALSKGKGQGREIGNNRLALYKEMGQGRETESEGKW